MVAWGVRAQAEHASLAQLKRQSSEFREAEETRICRAEYQRGGSYVKKELKNP